jgi:Glycosyltransferase family 87
LLRVPEFDGETGTTTRGNSHREWFTISTEVGINQLARLGVALLLAWVFLAAFFVRGTGDDWRIFWNAGHNVGSGALIGVSHFAYQPGAAWVLWPFARLPLATGYFIYVAIMLAVTTAAAWIAAKVYALPLPVATLMALAWAPFTIAICLGQNSPVALLFTMLAILGFIRRNEMLAGAAVGLLLYKPTDAIPFIFLLLIYRQWRSLGIVTLCGLAWYALSAAAANDWLWPVPYAHMLAALYRVDVVGNSDFAISIPTMLTRLHVPGLIGWALGAAVLLVGTPFLLRVRRVEAASVVPLIGIAASPHAWGYEALLALPAMWLMATHPNRLRATLLIDVYAIAPIYLYARALHFDALAVPILGGTACWFAFRAWALLVQERRRAEPAADPHSQQLAFKKR